MNTRRLLVASALAAAGIIVSAPVAATTASGTDGVDYGDPANWICRPDLDDPCDSGLDATAVAADATLTPEPFVADPDAPIDCFYVYPTISRDETATSDLDISGGEEGFVAANQVAPLGTGCRVFAPIYRQVTLAGLGGAAEVTDAAREQVYQDVVDAWNHYLEVDNGGRGVILIGHSQGAGVLTKLLADHVDTNESSRQLLVSAYLAGTNFQVPAGKDVGGALQNIPVCRTADQTGCVVTWSTYRDTAPPNGGAGIFGRPDTEAGTEAACSNPAQLAGGRTELLTRFPASGGSLLSGITGDPGLSPWLDPAAGEITTPYVTTPGLVTGGCVGWDGFNWLELTVHGDPGARIDDISGDLTPEWGMHLIDVNVVMGDLQRLVVSQGAAWLAAR